MLEYEVQIHFENGGAFNFKKKFENKDCANCWVDRNFGDDQYSCFIETDDGRSILVNMVKVLAVVLIQPQPQQEQQDAVSEVKE